MNKRGFFQDVQDLATIIKPIKESIILLENQEANLADCFFSLAQLGRSSYSKITFYNFIDIYLHDFCSSNWNRPEQFMRLSTTTAAL
ncbi:hypothetical protein RhiirA5_432758 [Rhizophagus irregularis]|uniref:Uncharacterized protein n=1 Tax=Rhizophagus irregularis TaxID=588596 RepID=A0A2N0NST0_9GLOM|nr:hypothetical protein RhiirA5_432758 [Rhizophagus irregularis]